MVFDALRGYVQLANGLTDVTRAKAVQTAKQVLEQGSELLSAGSVGVVATAPAEVRRQVQALAEDLIATSRTNRDLLVGLVRTEVERAIGRLGLVGADELAAMARVVERLQAQLDAAIAFGGRGAGVLHRSDEATEAEPPVRTVRREPVTFVAPAKAAPKTAKKTTAKKMTAKQTTATDVPVRRIPVQRPEAVTPATSHVGPSAVEPTPVEPTPAADSTGGAGE